jgi:hypothetical protein
MRLLNQMHVSFRLLFSASDHRDKPSQRGARLMTMSQCVQLQVEIWKRKRSLIKTLADIDAGDNVQFANVH